VAIRRKVDEFDIRFVERQLLGIGPDGGTVWKKRHTPQVAHVLALVERNTASVR
jgi:hypothetical protein